MGDGGAFDSASDQIAIQTIGQIAAIEPVGPLPQVARQMFGADAMMGADQLGFDVAEQGVDDREEFAGIGAVVLDHRGVFQIRAEIGAAIAGKPIGQQMRIGGNIGFKEGPQFRPVAAGSTAMRASPAKNPCWRLTACPCFPLRFFGAGTFSTAATTRLLSGLAVLRPGLVGVAAATNKGLVRFQKAVQRTGRILAQTMAQLVRHGPGRLIRHTQFALQKLGRDAALVATHQIGGEKPLGQIGSRSVKHRSGGRRFLPVAGRTFVHPGGAPSAATPGVRRIRHRQIRRASAARPSVRYTAARSQTAPQTLAAQPLIPPLIHWAMLP